MSLHIRLFHFLFGKYWCPSESREDCEQYYSRCTASGPSVHQYDFSASWKQRICRNKADADYSTPHATNTKTSEWTNWNLNLTLWFVHRDALDFITNKIDFQHLTQNRVKEYNKRNFFLFLFWNSEFNCYLVGLDIDFVRLICIWRQFCYHNLVLILSTLSYI